MGPRLWRLSEGRPAEGRVASVRPFRGKPAIRKPVVFISSTSDLKAEREAVAQTLRPELEPFLYEEHAAASGTP